ncbi:MAG: molybdopterin oxidoreductase family protein [Bilophila wadsworthia]
MRAAYIMGENPMQSDPDAAKVEAGLRNLDFLIVQDIFMTPTARLADVLLPAASYLEKQGTFTNTERRVQLINEVLPPLPGTRPDWRILCDVINALGGRADYDSPREIFNEIRQVVPSYAGMDYTRLAEEQGLCWPCPTPIIRARPICTPRPSRGGAGCSRSTTCPTISAAPRMKPIRSRCSPGASRTTTTPAR